MYESFFGFTERPFSAAVLAKRYFPAESIETAREILARCIDRAEGVGVLTGPAGTGKSLLCQVLADQFRSSLQVALLGSGQLCTRRALLQAILFELGLPYRGMEEGDLRLALVDQLAPRKKSADPVVETPASPSAGGLLLLVDEAHTLPFRLLEELRLITNLSRDGQPRVRLVLAGGPQLEERFASPKLEAFNQRVTARCYLEALDRAQTIAFVRHQLQRVGADSDRTFATDALDAIHHATDGFPRLINQVCDHVLLLAFAGGIRQITAAGVEEAWADLQQLPTPWNAADGPPSTEVQSGVVEFGSLDDNSGDDLPAAVPFRVADPVAQQPVRSLQDPTDLAVLADAEDDFHPAGSIRPEAELIFDGRHPFQEAYDEEEVVIDRYTSLETDAFANRPLVRSSESRELGALLTASEISTAPSVGIAPATWPGGVPSQSSQPPSPPVRAEKEPGIPISSPPNPLPSAPVTPSAPAPSTKGSASEIDDDDLIIIEDPPGAEPSPAKDAPRAHRQEYRQLFSQLRRG